MRKAIWKAALVALSPLLVCCVSPSYVTRHNAEAGLNGSLEVSDGGLPVNWTFSETPIRNGDLVLSLDDKAVREGQQSLRIEVSRAQTVERVFCQVWAKPGFSARRAIVPGKTYRISFWYRNVGAQVRMRWVTTSADYHQHFRHRDMLGPPPPADEWQSVEEIITVEEGEASVELVFVATEAGVFWCDDVRVEDTAAEE